MAHSSATLLTDKILQCIRVHLYIAVLIYEYYEIIISYITCWTIAASFVRIKISKYWMRHVYFSDFFDRLRTLFAARGPVSRLERWIGAFNLTASECDLCVNNREFVLRISVLRSPDPNGIQIIQLLAVVVAPPLIKRIKILALGYIWCEKKINTRLAQSEYSGDIAVVTNKATDNEINQHNFARHKLKISWKSQATWHGARLSSIGVMPFNQRTTIRWQRFLGCTNTTAY